MSLAIGALVVAASSSPPSTQTIAFAVVFPLLFVWGATRPTQKCPAEWRHAGEWLPGHQLDNVFSYARLQSNNVAWPAAGSVHGLAVVAGCGAVYWFVRPEDL